MIVNSHYGFVFVHVPKAAGTSVREALEGLAGNRSEWTARSKHEPLAVFDQNVAMRQGPDERLMRPPVSRYFRFGFVRNPWDRMVSLHRYLQEHHAERLGLGGASLGDLLERLDRGDPEIRALHSMRPQADYLTRPDGRMRIDFLGHFEHLIDDFTTVMARLRCPASALGHANRSGHGRQDHREVFDDRLRHIVERHFADDIRHFGYAFEQAAPVSRISGPLDRPR